ncbi:MAG: DNA alkylation repair protein [Burkholderiaceae bacterium]
MAEPLKNQYGPEVPARLAREVAAVHPGFDREAFLADALAGYGALDLMARGRHLPADFEAAVGVLLASVQAAPPPEAATAMAPFFYLPHTCFVAAFGLGHFEASMRAQHLLTQRFTAEFSIRPFLQHHTQATLERLAQWATDPSHHVRRLVSEGTRPRLPWGQRLRDFQQDPTPVLALLERLKDDPELYVRRSVANNLNDIGKDHPAVLVDTARRWLPGASPERRWLVEHALRFAVKRGDAGALDVLGFGARAEVAVAQARVEPAVARVGGAVSVAFELHNTQTHAQDVLVDFCIHYVKASGQTAPKVFKLKTATLAPGQAVAFAKRVSLAQMTTRVHHPGTHRVEVLVNGVAQPLGSFELLAG